MPREVIDPALCALHIDWLQCGDTGAAHAANLDLEFMLPLIGKRAIVQLKYQRDRSPASRVVARILPSLPAPHESRPSSTPQSPTPKLRPRYRICFQLSRFQNCPRLSCSTMNGNSPENS